MKTASFTGAANGIMREIISQVHIAIPTNNINPLTTALETKGLWDTGATNSVVTKDTAKTLGLLPITQANSIHAGGTSRVNVYLVDIFLPNRIKIANVKVIECEDSVGRFGIIIGMDIITLGDFSITNVGNKTTFSYRIPSSKTINYVEESNQARMPVVNAIPRVGRNQPCPCGSNKKYKNCHGNNATV